MVGRVFVGEAVLVPNSLQCRMARLLLPAAGII